VSKNADEATIKRAYRKLAVKWHPVRGAVTKCAAAPEGLKPRALPRAVPTPRVS
jgi:curved DNA-binding protein CbpA